MSEPFLGQVSCFGFKFAPKGWAFCQGQILPIQQNTALFSLLGTNFGGNGTTNFGLPNLQASVPIAYGQGPGFPFYNLGEVGGAESVTLGSQEMGIHNHTLNATSDVATDTASTNNQLGKPQKGSPITGFSQGLIYSPGAPVTPMNPQAIGFVGNNQPHNNMQPYLSLNYCIALAGIFPTRP